MKFVTTILIVFLYTSIFLAQGTKIVNSELIIENSNARLNLDSLILEHNSIIRIKPDVRKFEIDVHHLIVNGVAFIYYEWQGGRSGSLEYRKAASGTVYEKEDKKHGADGSKGEHGKNGDDGVNMNFKLGIDILEQLVIINRGGPGGQGGFGEFGGNGVDSDCSGDYGSGGDGGRGGDGGDGGNGGAIKIVYTSTDTINVQIDNTLNREPFNDHGQSRGVYEKIFKLDQFYYEGDSIGYRKLVISGVNKPLTEISKLDSLYCFKYYPDLCEFTMSENHYTKLVNIELERLHQNFSKKK